MSLRKGHFKKNMFTEEQLTLEAATLYPKIAELRSKWKNQILTDAEMAASYILNIVHHRHPYHTKLGPIKETFERKNLRSIPQAVNKMILNWLNGEADLILLEHVPTPKEVLAQQMQGKRCVTMMTDLSGLSKNVLGERDALGFLVHDLQHAERFFAHHETKAGQIGFYHLIGELAALAQVQAMYADSQFREEFEYAMSDMNAYCVHLLKYLTSAFREANKRLGQTQCPFLTYIGNHRNSQLIRKVYFLEAISKAETLELQSYFENFNERERACLENTCETSL